MTPPLKLRLWILQTFIIFQKIIMSIIKVPQDTMTWEFFKRFFQRKVVWSREKLSSCYTEVWQDVISEKDEEDRQTGLKNLLNYLLNCFPLEIPPSSGQIQGWRRLIFIVSCLLWRLVSLMNVYIPVERSLWGWCSGWDTQTQLTVHSRLLFLLPEQLLWDPQTQVCFLSTNL